MYCIIGKQETLHITAFAGCVDNRAFERDYITKLFRAQIPLITTGMKYYFKLGYTYSFIF
jgi:hypothetical protein